jgi:hypothetical protein
VGLVADGKQDPIESLWQLEVDLEPFNSHFPKMTRPLSIGDGVKFLNRQEAAVCMERLCLLRCILKYELICWFSSCSLLDHFRHVRTCQNLFFRCIDMRLAHDAASF